MDERRLNSGPKLCVRRLQVTADRLELNRPGISHVRWRDELVRLTPSTGWPTVLTEALAKNLEALPPLTGQLAIVKVSGGRWSHDGCNWDL